MQNMTFLFHEITKMITAELVYIKLINNKYKCEPKNIVNLKKTLIIHNTKKYFKIIVKSNIVFITFSKKNKKNFYLT